MVRILTYNIEFGQKLVSILEWVKGLEKKPDIVCFQEFPEKEIPYLEKNKIFAKQKTFFASAILKKETIFGELTVINCEKLKPGKTQIVKFFAHLPPLAKVLRSGMITEVIYGGKSAAVVSVHLSPLAIHQTRKRQLSEAIEALEGLGIKRSIILGDFNYSSLLGRNSLIKFMKKYGYKVSGKKVITNVYKSKIPQQLDYVFSKNLVTKNMEVVVQPFSDHYPVFVEFE